MRGGRRQRKGGPCFLFAHGARPIAAYCGYTRRYTRSAGRTRRRRGPRVGPSILFLVHPPSLLHHTHPHPPLSLFLPPPPHLFCSARFSDTIPFRKRSETPDIAIELSLQPWRAFHPDGVIFFSDILTPLPALGIEFDVVKGKGPLIPDPVRTMDAVRRLRTLDDPDGSLPFVRTILSGLRAEVAGGDPGAGIEHPAVLGFVGTPWTLAAYAVEGKADKHCMATKRLMRGDPATLHALLARLADAIATYAIHQIDSGAQAVQLFDSWAHHLAPDQYAEFSGPYSEAVVGAVRAARPGVPLILHANGGTGKLGLLAGTAADVVGLDWGTSLADARAALGPARVLAGNVDPMELFGGEVAIEVAVERAVREAAGGGAVEADGIVRHILNVGHGVAQGTPEEEVAHFCRLARERCAEWLPASVAARAGGARAPVRV